MARHLFLAITFIGFVGVLLNSPAEEAMDAARCENQAANCVGRCVNPGFCESFNRRMRDELLNETLFFGPDHARTKLTEWADDYDRQRPHSALGYLTPAA